MTNDPLRWSRRDFLRTAGAAGAGALLTGTGSPVAAADAVQVPTRPFGKTGRSVSILSLGGMFDIQNNQLMMKQAVRWGVTYWDTADCYQGGSERGIGKYFAKYPEDRKKVFLVTKSDADDPKGMTRLLDRSLERMNTDHVDLYFVHGIRRIREMDDTRKWSEQAKADGKIRLFGFSTHSNMEQCLLDAAGLGWIDGIMMTYNYRLMHTDRMREAVDACTEAGIGLTAMKTQGGGQVRTDSETELQLAGRFMEKGFTDGQAKLKAVWADPRIASICSQMPSMSLLMTNVAAATDQKSLTRADQRLLHRFAAETESAYCGGCTDICEGAVAHAVPVGDVMRALMYHRSYGDFEQAASVYRSLPPAARARIAQTDFSDAERGCPRHLAIASLMRQADEIFS